MAPIFIGCDGTIEDINSRLDRFAEELRAGRFLRGNDRESSNALEADQFLAERVCSTSNDTHEQKIWAFRGRWGACGMPIVRIDEPRWAASMMGTTFSQEFVGFVEHPWPAYMLMLPRGTGLDGLDVPDAPPGENASPWEVRVVTVHTMSGSRQCDSLSEQFVNVFATDGTETIDTATGRIPMLEQTCPAGELIKDAREPFSSGHWSSKDRRAMQLVDTLIVSVIAAFHSGMVRPVSARGYRKSPRAARIPSRMQFIAGSPIKHDVRAFVRNYVATGRRGGRMTVQSFIRGHWKRQAHGPRASLRKYIHIEPYWKGPDDARIAVRPHILTKSEARP
jgi:hypothetical protein